MVVLPARARLTSDFGSLRLPKTIAPLEASTHAGCLSAASLSAQKLHFSTTPLSLVGKSGFIFLMNFRGSLQLKLLTP
jgi:hypothetical protein